MCPLAGTDPPSVDGQGRLGRAAQVLPFLGARLHLPRALVAARSLSLRVSWLLPMLSALFSRAPEAPASRMPPPEQALIFATIGALLAGLFSLQRRAPYRGTYLAGDWLPRDEATGKRAYEEWVLRYSVVWMGSFGLIIALQLYEAFDAAAYFVVCGGLALPLWVQAFAAAVRAGRVTHALRAQAWVAVFGFIGNYWYTHYFYCVLRARYTAPALKRRAPTLSRPRAPSRGA